jgi:hypothetical protein
VPSAVTDGTSEPERTASRASNRQAHRSYRALLPSDAWRQPANLALSLHRSLSKIIPSLYFATFRVAFHTN